MLVIDLLLAAVLVAALLLGFKETLRGVSTGRRDTAGWLLVAFPLPLVVGIEAFAALPRALADAAFIAGLTAFTVGALLVLSHDDEDGRRPDADPESPPWWPDFERDFRAYARRSSRPRALR